MMNTTDRVALPAFTFDNTYARELEGLYIRWQPAAAPQPRMVLFNAALAAELGLQGLDTAEGATLLAGNRLPEGADPVAQAYSGHQFGGWSPRLGDGRALLLGEVIDTAGRRRDIAFKGSGRTPFSRGGDGKAALGPMLREYLIGEAMHALRIPTTRALAVVATGEPVLREGGPLPGAVLTRVAASHLRVGTFQYAAAQDDLPLLKRLLAYAIQRHDPALAAHDNPALALLQAVAERQAQLIAQWMGVGFIHGVMNTDNMTISGETIDYGPCAFMEAYNPATVFSSIDHGGRYAYGNQPAMARWNLARLAEALLPLLADGNNEAEVQQAVAQVTAVIDEFPALYATALRQGQHAKLGLDQGAGNAINAVSTDTGTNTLADDWLALLQQQQVDWTLAWRRLADAAAGDAKPLRALFADPAAVNPWLARWQACCAAQDAGDSGAGDNGAGQARAARMRQVNPWLIPRNHLVEEALAAASEHGDLRLFNSLLAALQRPFDEDAALAGYAQPAPAQVTAAYQTFCGT